MKLPRLFSGKKPAKSPAADLENPYRPIYRKPRRVEDIRPQNGAAKEEKTEKKADPR